MVEMKRLAGKTALITAAAQGIGRASVEAYAREGARVIAADINPEALETLATLENVTTLHLDVTDFPTVKSELNQIGPLDILFNCVGHVHVGSILDCDEDDWDFTFDVNAKAMYWLCRLAIPVMIENGGGSIINMSSVASSLKGVADRFVYSASKATVIGMTKAIAADFVTKGIRCNAICPGTVDSPSLQERLHNLGDYDAALESFIRRQPMGRIGKAEEIAALAVYLGSEESAFTTGQTHIIDGGWAN